MWKQIVDLVVKIVLAIGVLLSFLAITQLVSFCLLLYRVNPVAGWGLALFFLALLLWGGISLWVRLRRIPRVLKAPALPPVEEADYKALLRFCRYLRHYLLRLADNPRLPEASRALAREQATHIDETLQRKHHPIRDDLLRLIESSEKTILPLVEELRQLARKEVRGCVRDVMLGVTLIPYHGIDLLIIIYRSGTMVLRVAETFASRPPLAEQLLILKDVLRVVATVNFVNVSRNLIEGLFANVPVVGRYVDDIGQGLGAGIFTSAAGHAAIERCAAFRGWDEDQAVVGVAGKMRVFLADVRDIFTKDVLPGMKGRIRNEVPRDDVEQPGFWNGVTGAVGCAVDAVDATVETLVVRPAVAGTLLVADAGMLMKSGLTRAGEGVGRTFKAVGRSMVPGAEKKDDTPG